MFIKTEQDKKAVNAGMSLGFKLILLVILTAIFQSGVLGFVINTPYCYILAIALAFFPKRIWWLVKSVFSAGASTSGQLLNGGGKVLGGMANTFSSLLKKGK